MATLGETNRSEAERCIEIALTARQSGDLGKAERFLSKSISMYDTDRAATLLTQIRTELRQSSSQSTAHTPNGSTVRTEMKTTETSTTFTQSASTANEEKLYTPEQRAAAQKVAKLANFYEILGLSLPSSASPITDSEIKAAYRKMALKFHPDKNRAPEAEEAFKKVSAAYSTLSDSSKRRIYDQSGYQDPSATAGGGGGGFGRGGVYQHHQREDDFSPEDIFNMFFGMNAGNIYNMNGRRVYMRRPQQQQQQHHQQQQQGNENQSFPLMQFIHLLPLLLLFVFSFLSAPSSTTHEAPFSLHKTKAHSVARSTPSSSLPFFVDTNYNHRLERDRATLNAVNTAVEQEYVRQWTNNCKREQIEKQQLENAATYARARHGVDSDQYKRAIDRAHKYETSNCERLKTWQQNT